MTLTENLMSLSQEKVERLTGGTEIERCVTLVLLSAQSQAIDRLSQ